MRVLVACEFSGIVRDAFRDLGHDAWSCDLIASECSNRFHKIGDCRWILNDGWDLMIAHPPCTYLSRAGARWWKDENRKKEADKAEIFVRELYECGIHRICIENPIGQLNKRWRYPDQVIQPYQFGHPCSKATCLWLKNLPPLRATELIKDYVPFLPSNVGLGKRKGQKSSPGIVRTAKDASRTFQGIANAMAEQWGSI